MKFLRANKRYRFYRLSPWNAQMFLLVISQYPVLKVDYQRSSLTGDGPEFDEADKLLAAATEAHKKKLRRDLRRWLRSPGRLKVVAGQVELRIEPKRVEQILQVLNDVRVGCWVKLKSPSDLAAALAAEAKETVLHVSLMEMAGVFQMALLDAPGD